ncbi:hypothetical protein H2248_005181 [Termitomyces sp. 'cryptogamus']|nr:hypothetical protein H2248_005181 [Termitomyces sp. 'cryptogamus']
MDSDASDESGYESDEDLSWLIEDGEDDDDGSNDSNDPNPDDIDTDADTGSEGEPAEDEGRGSADPEDPPPPGSTTTSEPDDIPGPSGVQNLFSWLLIFTAVCVSAMEKYSYRPRERRQTQRGAEDSDIVAPEEGLGNATAMTILPCRKEIGTVTKLWVKPTTDLVPWVAPYTPWLAERIVARAVAPIPTPAVFNNQTSSVLMSPTANATIAPANVTISPAHAAVEYVRSIGARIRDASATEMYWGAIVVFSVIYVVGLLRTDWSVDKYEKKEVGVCLEVLEPMKEEKVKKKKKKNRKGKKKKVRGVEERVEEEGAEIDATVEQEKEKVGRKEGDAEETNEIDVMGEGKVEVEQAKGNTDIKEEIEEEECESERVENVGEMGGEPDTDEAMSDIGEFEDALDEIIATPSVPFADEEPNAVHVVDETAFDAEVHVNINTEMNSETAMEETEVGKVLEVDEPIEVSSLFVLLSSMTNTFVERIQGTIR